MKTRHCLVSLARNHGVALPPTPDVWRYVVQTLAAIGFFVARLVVTLADAVLMERKPCRKTLSSANAAASGLSFSPVCSTAVPVALSVCVLHASVTSEPFPPTFPPPPPLPLDDPEDESTPLEARKPSELALGRMALPLAPPLLWPLSLPLVVVPAPEPVWYVERLRFLEPSKLPQRQMVQRRRAVACREVERPEAVCTSDWVSVRQVCDICNGTGQADHPNGGINYCPNSYDEDGFYVDGCRRSAPPTEADLLRMTVHRLRKLVKNSRTMKRPELTRRILSGEGLK